MWRFNYILLPRCLLTPRWNGRYTPCHSSRLAIISWHDLYQERLGDGVGDGGMSRACVVDRLDGPYCRLVRKSTVSLISSCSAGTLFASSAASGELTRLGDLSLDSFDQQSCWKNKEQRTRQREQTSPVVAGGPDYRENYEAIPRILEKFDVSKSLGLRKMAMDTVEVGLKRLPHWRSGVMYPHKNEGCGRLYTCLDG